MLGPMPAWMSCGCNLASANAQKLEIIKLLWDGIKKYGSMVISPANLFDQSQTSTRRKNGLSSPFLCTISDDGTLLHCTMSPLTKPSN